MATFTHQLLSRKTSTPEVWQCECEYSSQPHCYGVRRCVAHGLCKSRFHSTRWKVRHHVTWCLAKTSYPTSRWVVDPGVDGLKRLRLTPKLFDW